MKKFLSIFALVMFLLSLAWGKDSPILPQSFHGWQKTDSAKASTNPAAVDPANAAVLKEYGFSDAELATYTRDGRTIHIKALRFSDSSGAYGSLTFYAQPQMQTEKIGDQAASDNARIVLYRG